MNIFVVDEDPATCAEYLDDKRVVKMVLETAQMLSTALGDAGFYRPTHANHPCSRWVRESLENYVWTRNLFVELCVEYTARYERQHACERFLCQIDEGRGLMVAGGLTPFADCSGVEEDAGDIFDRYRECLKRKWATDKRPPTWFGKTP